MCVVRIGSFGFASKRTSKILEPSSRLWILPEIAELDLILILNSGNLNRVTRTSFSAGTRDLSLEGVSNVTGIVQRRFMQYKLRL